MGFFVKATKSTPPTIYYNDTIESEGAIRFTIFHELKHYVFEDDDDEDDDLADFFCKIFYVSDSISFVEKDRFSK